MLVMHNVFLQEYIDEAKTSVKVNFLPIFLSEKYYFSVRMFRRSSMQKKKRVQVLLWW